MKKEETVVQVTNSGSEITVNTILPVWFKENPTGGFVISIPVFGLETNCETEDEISDATEEAITLFFKSAVKFGRGIDEELKALGWERKAKKAQVFNLPKVHLPIFDQVFNTGHSQAFALNI